MGFHRPLWGWQPFPDLVRGLPEIDVPVAGVTGWLLQGKSRQLVFLDIEAGVEVPPHRHGEQWGLVIQGEMDLTVGGVTRRIGPGDWYHIPDQVEHGAVFLTRVQAMDYFADRDRYKPKR